MSPEPLDPVIHQVVRLRVMAVLCRNRAASFVWVRESLGLTDGNLGSHVARLVAAGYVQSARTLTRSGFQVWIRITPTGDEAYRAYLGVLRSYLETSGPEQLESPEGESRMADSRRTRGSNRLGS